MKSLTIICRNHLLKRRWIWICPHPPHDFQLTTPTKRVQDRVLHGSLLDHPESMWNLGGGWILDGIVAEGCCSSCLITRGTQSRRHFFSLSHFNKIIPFSPSISKFWEIKQKCFHLGWHSMWISFDFKPEICSKIAFRVQKHCVFCMYFCVSRGP